MKDPNKGAYQRRAQRPFLLRNIQWKGVHDKEDNDEDSKGDSKRQLRFQARGLKLKLVLT